VGDGRPACRAEKAGRIFKELGGELEVFSGSVFSEEDKSYSLMLKTEHGTIENFL